MKNSPIWVNDIVTVSNTGKCVSFYLEMLRIALDERSNGIKSHRVSMIDQYIKMLSACGVEVAIE